VQFAKYNVGIFKSGINWTHGAKAILSHISEERSGNALILDTNPIGIS
jgi:hypothetical protein